MNTPRKYLAMLLGILLCGLFCTGCSKKQWAESSFFAMDTYMSVRVWAVEGEELTQGLEEEILRVENLLAVTDPESDLYRLNHADGESVALSEETAALLKEVLPYCQNTQGALNIALYPLSQAWGFARDGMEENDYRVVSEEERKELLPFCDWEQLTLDGQQAKLSAGMGMDLGAVGKGYVTDTCINYLKNEGVTSALLELGGNVYAMGHKENGNAWNIAIQDPFNVSGGSYAGVVKASDVAIVTSGSYQRYFEKDGVRYHHILDPATGAPAESGLASVTIISPSGLQADCLSTAFFVMGLEKSVEYWQNNEGFDVVWVTGDGDLYVTEGVTDSFEASDGWEIHTVTR